ncbi:LPS export ABC transporter permease LptF [Rhizobium sp. YJ-22]|uniref:LPS export ABC transporter permease LptF n=1 Tax=Rhizobium sp. YJ-22 TaxID=3037556 RepID=UPI0024124CA9|nr:LPS export ABC transporter permease LptF [Rhizobium sp. YJ-22]MDG3577261.1 LPS export ABC transporter permease LptF [Rhizobium sp. YJ-22]
MKLLESYIMRRVIQMFLVALLPVLAIIWTTQVLNRINLVTDNGQSVGSFMKLATLILPTIIPIVLPFAAVIGVSQTLTSMNNDSELTVIEAAGASRWTIIRPVIILAGVLSLFSFTIDNLIEPKVRVAAREMVAATYADLLSSVIEEKTFRRVEDGLYIQISERHSGRVLKGLLVADSRDPAFDLIYYAREGAVNAEGTALIMHDGEVHRKIPGGNVSIIRFDSYSFDLSDLTQSRGQTTLRPGDRSLAYLLNPDPDDKNVREDPGAYRAELHRRLTEWSFPLLFSLVALVIAGDARSHRDARLHPLISALSISFLLRWASFYSANQAESRPFFILVMYAVPLIAGGCLIYLLMAHRKLKIPASVTRLSSEAWQQALKLRKDDAAKGGQS